MTSATELLHYAVASFQLKVSCGEEPTFTECLRESLYVHEPERYERPKRQPRYRVVGKLGPLARYGKAEGRYLATGLQEKPIMKMITGAAKSGDSWRYVEVLTEDSEKPFAHGCGTNVYETY